jgi:hypothetical protein
MRKRDGTGVGEAEERGISGERTSQAIKKMLRSQFDLSAKAPQKE